MSANYLARSAHALRTWARGDLCCEATVELLTTAVGGRLLAGPWVHLSHDGRAWFDPEIAAAESGYLSGGERRVLAVAASLVSPQHPVDLGDAITGLDPATLQLVLEALAHASSAATGWPIARPSS